MPYPAQVTRDQIVEQARQMIERDGLERLTLQALAAALGVQAPSLYRHVASKNALLKAVNTGTLARLIEALLDAAAGTDHPVARIERMAAAYRAFALAHPITYPLAMTNTDEAIQPDHTQMQALVLPVQAVIAGVSGEAKSLSALGGFWALIHGYVMLEIAGQFRRAPDLDAMFQQVIVAYLRGWSRP